MPRLTCFRSPRPLRVRWARGPGFTLIEMAVGLLVLSLLLATLLAPISAQIDQRKISDTQNALAQISEALTGYALSKGYLPCPDKTTGAAAAPNDTGPNDGVEDLNPAGTACTAANNEGNLPWTTLGIPATDAWGNFFRYRVDNAFAGHAKFTLTTAGTLTVKCPSTACPPSGTTYTTSAPAVLMSHGKNGRGAISSGTKTQIPYADASADEQQNITHTIANTFYMRISTTGGSAAGGTVTPFDDIVVWLSTPVLMSRMVAAQKLP
jgi:prepilin-type N-terminal cleavage/methylation domain-containing protein